jgi:hypothetical protein
MFPSRILLQVFSGEQKVWKGSHGGALSCTTDRHPSCHRYTPLITADLCLLRQGYIGQLLQRIIDQQVAFILWEVGPAVRVCGTEDACLAGNSSRSVTVCIKLKLSELTRSSSSRLLSFTTFPTSGQSNSEALRSRLHRHPDRSEPGLKPIDDFRAASASRAQLQSN